MTGTLAADPQPHSDATRARHLDRVRRKAHLPHSTYTTGEVAAVAGGVATRTAAKWMDSNRITSYRLPGSKDRRVQRDDLIRFLAAHKFAAGLALFVGDRRAIGVGTTPPQGSAPEGWSAGAGYSPCVAVAECQSPDVAALLVCLSVGRAVVADLVKATRHARPDSPPRVVLLASPDVCPAEAALLGCDAVLFETASPADIWAALAGVQS